MKKIEAIIRPSCLKDVEQALMEVGITGMTVMDAIGLGRQKGYHEVYRGSEYNVNFLSKIKIEIVVDEDIVDNCVEAIMQASRTGNIGDGKIFISSIEKVLRIRTGEQGREAM